MSDQMLKQKGVADIVFLVDATGSMQPCIDALKQNILTFVKALEAKDANGGQIVKHWRAKVVGYRDYTYDPARGLPALVDNPFVESVAALETQLASLEAKGGGDEPESLLDALYAVIMKDSTSKGVEVSNLNPELWRYTSEAHRFVIVFTDAPYHPVISAEGSGKGGTVTDLVHEIVNHRIKLYIFAPRMDCYEELTQVDRGEYTACDCDSETEGARQQALAAFTADEKNFVKLMQTLAKSISANSSGDVLGL